MRPVALAVISAIALLGAEPAKTDTPSARTTIRYDAEYPTIGYADNPTNNAIARLQKRLDKGEVRLKFEGPRGYLDSALAALGIDPSSQTLVYSKTSLQFRLITGDTPRAIYFNDDTYVAWIPGTQFLEMATVDAEVGPVFYTLSNTSPTQVSIDRETSRCLTCHDTWGMAGGGVPKLLFLSTLVDRNGESLNGQPGADTSDQTPIRDRWAGWFVTGQHGKQTHLGNILAEPDSDESLEELRRGNIDSLKTLFDAKDFLTDKSDIVALLIFEHQAHVGNLITRANYKARTLLARNVPAMKPGARWQELSPELQRQIKAMSEPLVKALLFVDAAPLEDTVRSTSGFDEWFQSRGPRDAAGRSLRDLDLHTRVFRYPLSYLIYSAGFEGLPACVKDYIHLRVHDILSGRDSSPNYASITPESRRTVLEILASTKPGFSAPSFPAK